MIDVINIMLYLQHASKLGKLTLVCTDLVREDSNSLSLMKWHDYSDKQAKICYKTPTFFDRV